MYTGDKTRRVKKTGGAAKAEHLPRRGLPVGGEDLLRALHQHTGPRLHVRVRVAVPQADLHLAGQVEGEDALERLLHQQPTYQRANVGVVGEEEVGAKDGRRLGGRPRPEVAHQLRGGAKEEEGAQLVAEQCQRHAGQSRVIGIGGSAIGHFVFRGIVLSGAIFTA
ncbi:hypothetical protein TYRP_012150 [Tyrophagus putrescentiae]|nr:hypothetical protein TYRP_012150 [Tyrophagus putrescentiae]